MKRDLFYFIIIFVVFSLAVIVATGFDPEVLKVDKGCYGNNTASVLEDGDLNTINQALPRDRWLVTKTYNHPDFHDHGIATLWIPFFAYWKLLEVFDVEPGVYKSEKYDVSQIVANIFYGMICLVLIYRFMFSFFDDKRKILLSIGTVCFGTSFYWYFLFHPANSDITITILPVILVGLYLYLQNSDNKWKWGLFGLIFGCMSIIKVSMVFYLLILLHNVVLYWRYNPWNTVKVRYLPFVSGFIISIIPFLINERIKYGFFNYGHLSLFNESYYLLKEVVLGPSGYFYVSPIYFIFLCSLIIYLIRLCRNKNSLNTGLHSFFAFLGIVLVVKTLIESFTFGGNGGLGARHFIVDTFVCVLFIHFVTKKLKFYKLWILYIPAILWTLMVSVWYFHHLPNSPVTWGQNYIVDMDFFRPTILLMLERFSIIVDNLGSLLFAAFKYSPLIAISSFLVIKLYKMPRKKDLEYKVFKIFGLYIFGCYLLITCLNVVFNSENVELMKQDNFFSKTVVAGGVNLYSYDENVSSMLRMSRYLSKRGDLEGAEKIEKTKQKYIKQIMGEILVDPVGFKKNLEKEILRRPFN